MLTTESVAEVNAPAAEPVPLVVASQRVMQVVRANPGIILTGAYLLMAFVGFSYNFWLFLYFRILIVDYAEASDFLSVPLREPVAIVLCLLPLAIVWGVVALDRYLRRRSARYMARQRRYANTVWGRPGTQLAIWTLFVFIYGFTFTQLYAQRTATSIKTGRGRRLHVDLNANGAPIVPGPLPRDTAGAILLGSTSRFMFLYYPADSATYVVPVDNLARIVVPARGRRRPAAAR